MPTKKITSLTEYDAVPATTDHVVLVDVSDTSQASTGTTKRMNADRFVATDGTQVNTTGGGTIVLGGYTLTVPKTGSVQMIADAVKTWHYPFYLPRHVLSASIPEHIIPYVNSTSYTTTIGVNSPAVEEMQCVFNVSKIPTNATVKLKVRVQVGAASTGSVRIVNSAGTEVTGSPVTTTSLTYEWVTSGDIKANLTAGEETYRISMKNSATNKYTMIGAALFVVEVA